MNEPSDQTQRYRSLATLWICITGSLLLPPFAVNNFLQGRLLMGVVSTIVVVALVFVAWTIYRGKESTRATMFGMIPALILFLGLSIHFQGMIGVLWCYPTMLVFFFILPRFHALTSGIVLFLIAVPMAWIQLEPSMVTRIMVSFFFVLFFPALFTMIIDRQQRQLAANEMMRRDGMASASHELRTPLATLLAQVEAMRDGIRPLDQAQLQSVSNNLVYLNKLVDDMYVLSLADLQTLVCAAESFHPAAIIAEAITSADEKLSERDLSIHLDVDPRLTISGDPERFRQILDNLLENCVRYTTPEGNIFITAQQTKNEVAITVEDSGPGVSPEARERLFERFFRIDKSRSRSHGGTGIGLALVKALIEVQGGFVNAFQSDKGGLGIALHLPHREQLAGGDA